MNDLIILGMLVAGPKHGYRLKQDATMFSGAQRLHNNTVYPLLKEFLKKGWITQEETGGDRGQTRLLYALTSAGRSALVAKLTEFSETDAASAQAFRLRVGLFELLLRESRQRILQLRDDFLSSRLKRVQMIAKSRDIGTWGASSVSFVIKEIQLERRWIAQLMAQI